MESAQNYRSMALLCRQQAVLDPQQRWKWLGQAERWEHLAEASFAVKPTPQAEPDSAAAA